MFERVHERGELFHVLFHPERLLTTHAALAGLIDHLRSQESPVWSPTLNEVADWWQCRGEWYWERMDDRSVRVTAPPAATLLARSPGPSVPVASHRPIHRDYFLVSSSNPLPLWTIGVSPRSPQALRVFLHEEGFLVEQLSGPTGCSLYLDRPSFDGNDGLGLLKEIDSCDKPLLRLWRWPNGCRSAFCLSADICAIDLRDFFARTRHF
jgi:hypothetical protein